MGKPVRDYRQLRLSNLTSPQYRHLFWLLGWVVYFTAYFLTEALIPEEACHLVTLPIDYKIPFCEWFALFYVGWYALIAFSLGYFLLYDVDRFKSLQQFILVTQGICLLCYVIYPTMQDLRPDLDTLPRHNIATWIMSRIYAADTPTGVCPSMHVSYSIGIASTWLKDKTSKKWLRIATTIFCLLVCASVSLVKQHALIDIVLAIPVCLAAEIIAFGSNYWLPKFRKVKIG